MTRASLTRVTLLGVILSIFLTPLSSFALTSANTSNTKIVPNGLVGHWTFDGKNMTNATATDKSGSGNHGALVGMTQASSKTIGKIGQALNFKATTERVQIQNSSSIRFDAGSSATFSAWLYLNAATNQGGNYQSIFEKGGVNDAAYQVFIAGTSRYLTFYSDNGGVISSGVAVSLNRWNHITVVATGGVIYFYINGTLVASPSGNFKTESGTAPLYLSDWGHDNAIFGSIDDARIYNRALSTNEIQSLYKAGGGVVQYVAPKSSLVGHWTFDQPNMTNATATDISGSGNNGTLINMTATSSRTTGKTGQALTFSRASGQAINLGNIAAYGPSADFTIAAWIKANDLSTFQCIYCKDIKGDGASQFRFTTEATGKLKYAAGTESINGNTTLSTGTWYHAIFTRSSLTGLLSVYLNGVNNGTTSIGSTPSTNAANVYIGSRQQSGSPVDMFDGVIDDVRFYSRALSATEALNLYKTTDRALVVTKQNVTNTNTIGINSGLVGYWTFDGKNMTNATATDSSGQGNNGILTNMTQASAKTIGKVGQGMNFFPGGSDTNAYINVADPVSGVLDFGSSDFTVGFWMNGYGNVFQGSGYDVPVIKANYNGGLQVAGYSFTYTSDNKMTFILGNGSSGYAAAQTVATAGDRKWHHYTGLRSGNTIYLYIDGVTVASTTVSGSISNTVPLMIGGDSGGQRNTNAKIDDVRIYNRALSASEIKSLYKLGTQ